MKPIQYQAEAGWKEITPTAAPIRSASVQPLPAAAPGAYADYTQPHANPEQNSRLAASLPAGPWTVRWQAEINPAFRPTFVLAGNDAVVVQAGEWRLFDRQGRPVSRDRLGLGPMALDTGNGYLYHITINSYLAARRLADGGPFFQFLPRFGDLYARTFYARNGQRLLVAGVEFQKAPLEVKIADTSMMQVTGLGNPIRADEMGDLASMESPAVLLLPWVNLVVAAHGEWIVAATPGHVYFLDWKLGFRAAFEASFEPQAMSLDEAGRVYLVAASETQTSLWLLTPAGERLYSFALPPGTAAISTPPIVGYDHTVYLIAGQYIFAVAPDGKLHWSRAATGAIAGAVLTGDGQLLTAEGSQIAAWNQRGERRVVHAFPGEDLATPPVLTTHGDLLVASRGRLFCLTHQP